jgi:N-acetylglutamate synthase-like GNAT family acetyltransferase
VADITRGDTNTAVFRNDKAVLGTTVYVIREEAKSLEMIYIAANQKQAGIGTNLIELLKKQVKEYSLNRLVCYGATSASEFFEKMGFKLYKQSHHHYGRDVKEIKKAFNSKLYIWEPPLDRP